MLRTYKYRIYPSKKQRVKLLRWLNTFRIVYNNALAERRDAWSNGQRKITCYDQINELKEQKPDNPYLQEVHSQVLQDTLRRLNKSFQNFFRRVKNGENPGYPRFKGRNRYDSFTYPQSGFEINENRLYLSKIGSVKIKSHREMPSNATIKTCTIKRDVDQWYACFSIELPDVEKNEINNVVGVDVGLESMMTLSNGDKIENPRWLRISEKKLVKEQRRLSTKQKGSNNRNNQRIKVARLHRKIRNQRRDFHHKVSRTLVNNYDLVVFEDLNITNMVKNRHLAKSISDAGWLQLANFTAYKTEEAGKHVDFVDPNGTSVTCSRCGHKISMPLWRRIYECPNCGLVIDRDHNSGINVLSKSTVGTTGRACLSSPIGDAMIQEALCGRRGVVHYGYKSVC